MSEDFVSAPEHEGPPAKRRLDQIKVMRTAGITLLLAVAALPRVNEALQAVAEGPGDLLAWGRAALYIAVMLLIAAWIVSSYMELGYLMDWTERIPHRSSSPTAEAYMVFSVAVALSILLAFVESIPLFALTYFLYMLVDTALWYFVVKRAVTGIYEANLRLLRRRVDRLSGGSKERELLENQMDCLKVLLSYYQSWPQEGRRAGAAILALVLLILIHSSAAAGQPLNAGVLYLIYTVVIIGGEAWLSVLRMGIESQLYAFADKRLAIETGLPLEDCE